MRLFSRKAAIRLAVLCVLLLIGGVWGWACTIRMPASSFEGPLAPLSPAEAQLAQQLRADVEHLADAPRNLLDYARFEDTVAWIEQQFAGAGLEVRRHTFETAGRSCHNVAAEVEGTQRPAEIVLVGAHYDSVPACPGANDNASGVAALLAILRAFSKQPAARSIRFVAFANEEPPYFQDAGMGSLAYAKHSRDRGDQIVAMFSLETIGYYSDEPGSQSYPFPLSLFYPSRGNFIAFVGDLSSRELVHQAIGAFRQQGTFPSEGAALPRFIPGVDWSDHWSFWQYGAPAVMVTDTAPFRYPHYHTEQDTPDKLDYERFARVTTALVEVVRDAAAGK